MFYSNRMNYMIELFKVLIKPFFFYQYLNAFILFALIKAVE